MVKTMVSCRFSLKPIHWTSHPDFNRHYWRLFTNEDRQTPESQHHLGTPRDKSSDHKFGGKNTWRPKIGTYWDNTYIYICNYIYILILLYILYIYRYYYLYYIYMGPDGSNWAMPSSPNLSFTFPDGFARKSGAPVFPMLRHHCPY
jgi:hypothetical protein